MESVGKWISTIHRYAHIFFNQEADELGIGGGQFSFLFLLYRQDGVSQDHLAKKLYIDKATTARAIQKLEECGFVRREKSEIDRRQNLVYLTDKAHGVKEQVMETLANWTNILTKDFSEEEYEIVLRLLKKMAGNATEHISKGEGCKREG
ncbi:MarR family winged helix-turn-helix transcriptional regulator [Bacillus solimangrovi]|uniref:HTH marR-type domain-containing protein n=1 Tax=Bacillus solimangrovi TaxID=1305675 RepID=A0A1E5LIY5_9BACI|nr:MarR family winged helix-turn-helix transcriptional regulator [Bacillus solimangrovi]OEH94045.1 hypothetical protein BFG57_10390 [Bacillus solimangrovi]